ncbi:MAG: hypothetical protein C5B52_04275 [Bacteroidetes bacterium]|nr:MAG: hypothetical protein C5B52_04275 [Bacteroidota bacterium]
MKPIDLVKRLVSFILLLFLAKLVPAQNAYWQQQVNYKIDVTLNTLEKTLDAFERIQYTNNSPDTLLFIWFHLWPNAFKNDKTAFSDQLLQIGRTDFYFSSKDQKGYINRLDFRVNDVPLKVTDHPNFQDVVRLNLNQPLPPGATIEITTPFHVRLPYNFSRGGHIDQSYQITQWYPKPAVYDKNGWHPMPYLDQGEFYSEFGNFEVKITLPENFIVAATGELQTESEKTWLLYLSNGGNPEHRPAKNAGPKRPGAVEINPKKLSLEERGEVKNPTPKKPVAIGAKKTKTPIVPQPSSTLKTLIYRENNIHDFAWFADMRFVVRHDTLQLPSGRVIDLFAYVMPDQFEKWKNCISYMKDAVSLRSKWIGEYPFPVVSVVQMPLPSNGGMEYPTITLLSALPDTLTIDETVQHEIGHNWFYGVLGSNERDHPWMDEGINTFYDRRYTAKKYGNPKIISLGSNVGLSEYDFEKVGFETIASVHKDQPINESSVAYTPLNYVLVVYHKTGEWMKLMEKELGQPTFDSCMHAYFSTWKYKHPMPEDFKAVLEKTSGKNLDSIFQLLDATGSLSPNRKKPLKFSFIAHLDPENKYHYISLSPIMGINAYDGAMPGLMLHNYNLPYTKFQFLASAMYATRSKTINTIDRATYTWFPKNVFQKVEIGTTFAKFSMNEYTDSSGNRNYMGFTKLVPQARFEFKNSDPRSQLLRFFQIKSYFISEDHLHSFVDTINNIETYSINKKYTNISQMRYVTDNSRELYPYHWELQFEVAEDFGKAAFTGNYFFNYSGKGGIDFRWFAGKFFYLGNKTNEKELNTDRYHLNMTGPKGEEDYTYSNYFFGRNDFEGFNSQQIMIRDGAFKVRTDYLNSKIGKTDNWLASMNFTSTIPDRINPLSILPIKIPLKLFLDVGTYGDVWSKNSTIPKFLYDAGLQISLIKDLVNIYVPLLYSNQYRDYFKSTPGNDFWQRISFSIDIQNINYKKIKSIFLL